MEKNVYSRKSRKKHTVHKVCAWMLAVLMLFSALPTGSMTVHAETGDWTSYAAENFESGTGKADDPYIIKTPEQLAMLSGNDTYKSCHFKVADGVTEFDMSDYEWVPIEAFYGTFDGNGVTIKGLGINNSAAEERVGFIFNLGKSDAGLAVIKNLNFADVSITVTRANTLYVGVIAGRAYSATIDNCKVLSGSVTATGTKTYVGGLVGIAETPSTASAKDTLNIYNCYNNSNINATSTSGSTGVRAGGIAGYIYKQNAAIINTANAGDITVTNASTHTSAKAIAGGLISTLSNGVSGVTDIVSNCYNAGMVSAAQTSQKNTLDGIVGAVGIKDGSTALLENCYYAEGSGSSSTYGEAKTIQSEDFITTLNANATNNNAEANEWGWNDEDYPVPYVETKIGEKRYATLQAAIKAADTTINSNSEATVEIDLQAKVNASDDITINSGVALDLNGYTLNMGSNYLLSDGDVVDNSEDKTGRLKIATETVEVEFEGNTESIVEPKGKLAADNSQMPVYIDGEGYMFVAMRAQAEENIVNDLSSFNYISRPSFGAAHVDKLQSGASVAGLQFILRLDWGAVTDGVYENNLEFSYSDELVGKIYTNGTVFSVTVNGLANYASNMKVGEYVISDLGVKFENNSFYMSGTTATN